MVLRETLRDAREILRKSKVPYAVVGGVAVNALGIPRTTADFDVVVDLDAPGKAELLLAEARKRGFSKAEKAPDLQTAGMTTLLRGAEALDIIAAQSEPERDLVRTAVVRRAFGQPLKVSNPERLIVFKAISATVPGREKDISDARDVCALAGVNEARLVRLARRHGPATVKMVRFICRTAHRNI